MNHWYKDWFDSVDYLQVYYHRDKKDAVNLLKLIKSNIASAPGSKVLDAACGNGRFSNIFAVNGYKVTAFDLSRKLLNLAVKEALKLKLPVQFIQADLRNVPIKSSFDLILNMFTSFGYFKDEEENYSFIKEAYSLLNKDGIFVFDFLNKEYLIHNLIPYSEKKIDNKTIIEKRSINNNRIEKEIIIITRDTTKKYKESVHLYSKDEITQRFKSYGFTLKYIFGNYLGQEYDKINSERLLMLFKK